MDSESGDVRWVQNYNSPVVAMYIWQREGLRKVPHTNFAVETLRYLTFMSGEVGRITQWKYPFPEEKKPKNKLMYVPPSSLPSAWHSVYSPLAFKWKLVYNDGQRYFPVKFR